MGRKNQAGLDLAGHGYCLRHPGWPPKRLGMASPLGPGVQRPRVLQALPLRLGVVGCSHLTAFLEPRRVSRKQVHSERPWAWWARQPESLCPTTKATPLQSHLPHQQLHVCRLLSSQTLTGSPGTWNQLHLLGCLWLMGELQRVPQKPRRGCQTLGMHTGQGRVLESHQIHIRTAAPWTEVQALGWHSRLSPSCPGLAVSPSTHLRPTCGSAQRIPWTCLTCSCWVPSSSFSWMFSQLLALLPIERRSLLPRGSLLCSLSLPIPSPPRSFHGLRSCHLLPGPV